MNNELVIILLAAGGALLIYAAVKGKNPADVVRDALGGNR